MNAEKEATLRREMTELFSKNPDLTSQQVKKVVDDAIKEMKKALKAKLPTPTIEDPYGTKIVADSRVAYNFQGEVRLGVVKVIRAVRRNGKTTDFSGRPYVEIVIDGISAYHQKGPFQSKVSNPRNLVVLP